ncbi:MAG: beta strand repeat-containing protein [Burkholderiales bacterium]
MPIFVTDLVVVQRFATSLYAVQVGQTTMAQVNNEIRNASGDLDKVCNKFFNLSFGSVPVATIASTLVANLGITTGAADATTYISNALNATPAAARGAKVSELLNLFSNLETDPIYGTAAKAWNAKIDGAVAYIGTNDVALNAGAVFQLTLGIDKVLGTAGNDTIVSEAYTLNDADTINGGAGTDTLAIVAKTTDDRIIAPITTSVENVKIQGQYVTLNTSDNNLNSGNTHVQLDVNRMVGVTNWESNNSRETVVVEDVRILDSQITKDITITMRETDPGNVDYGVYFDQNSLRNVNASTSRVVLQVLDTGAAGQGLAPLLNADVQGFSFEYTDNKTSVKLTANLASNAINAATTFADLQAAFQAAANAQFGAGVVSVSLGTNFSVIDPLSGKTVTGTNVVLQVNGDYTVTPIGWSKSGTTPAGSNIYTNYTTVASTSTDLVTSKIVLDDVGRGSHGGDLVVGGLSVGTTSTSQGVQRFEITVEDNSKLTSVASTNNTLREVTIVNGTTTRVNNAYNDNVKDAGNLTVKNYETGASGAFGLPGQSGLATGNSVAGFTDVRLIDASTFKGKLDISAAITAASVGKYLTLTDGASDYTADNIAFLYSAGSNADTLDVSVDNTYVSAGSMPSLSDREDFGLTINGNGGNDKITLRHTDNTGAVNPNINVIKINGGEGNDTVTSTGEGNITVDGGTGDDTVYLNQSGNNAFATSNWTTAPGFNTPNGFKKFLYGGQLTVSFAPSNGVTAAAVADAVSANFTNGYEVTVAIPTGANATLNQFYLNQAIKNAINNNAVLNKLLKAEDMPGTQLKITSLIDGGQNLAQDLVMRVSAADITTDSAALAAYRLYMADSTLNGAAAQTANVATLEDTTDGLNTVRLNTWTPSATSGAAGLEGDNRVDLAAGSSDVVVLGSNANSNDTVVFNGYDLGLKTVVNFNDTNGTSGSDYLDFTSYLTSRLRDGGAVDKAVREGTTLNADATVEANSVTRLTAVAYTTTDTFAGLTADKLLAAINGGTGTAYAGIVDGTLNAANYGTTVSGGLVNEGKAVVMVENTANQGYYRVFELTFAANSTTGQFTAAKLIADVDFGASTDFSGTSPTNDNLI